MAAASWVRGARADPEQLFTLRVALASGSSDAHLEQAVRAVTDVASPQYGQYVRSQEQLRTHWAPSEAALQAMQTFVSQLKKTAAKGSRVHVKESPLGDSWLLRMDVRTAEGAFQTEIYEYAHAKHKELLVLRPGENYVVPVCIEDHVVYLDGLESFPTEMQANLLARSSGERTRATTTAQDSSQVVSPALIRTQYDFPIANASSANATARTLAGDVSASNKLVIGTFLHEFYTESDLKQFLDRYESSGQTIKYPAPKGDCIAGLPDSLGSRATGEASLDVQVAASLAHSDNIDVMCYTTLRDNARPMAADNQEPFLTFMHDVNAMDPPPSVVSISYTDDECSTPHGYMLAVNRELMKAAMKGISVIISAGDAGVQGSDLVESFCKIPACSQFNAMFPASSPYATSVGATSLNFAKPKDNKFQEHVTSTRTGALITSGGGFSTVFPQPSYQQRAVASYLAKDSVVPLMSMFESQGRAYPDIAALGHSFPVITNGQMWPTDGTSVSAPIVASMVVIINEMLLKQGKPVLGFLNPLLYQLADVCPHVFEDITRGDSACGGQAMSCCPTGHLATEGWDAVSGVGTLKVDAFVTHLQGCMDQIRLQAVEHDNQNIELQRQPADSWHRSEQQIEQLLFGAALIAGVVLASVLVSLRSRLFVDVCALDIRYPHHDRDAPAREHLLSGSQNV